jgi:hypothetical protein
MPQYALTREEINTIRQLFAARLSPMQCDFRQLSDDTPDSARKYLYDKISDLKQLFAKVTDAKWEGTQDARTESPR